MPYNNTQLREMAHGIRGKIRKINQKHANTPDSTPAKFLDLIIKIVERVKSRVLLFRFRNHVALSINAP